MPLDPKEKEELNYFRINFTISTVDTFSEEELETLSKHTLIHFRNGLRKMGVHLPSTKIDNECFQEKKPLTGYGGDSQSKKFSDNLRKSLPESEKDAYEGSPLQLFLDEGKREFTVPLKEVPSFKCSEHKIERCKECIKEKKVCPRCGCPAVSVKWDHHKKRDYWVLDLMSDGTFIDYCPFCGVPLWPLVNKPKEVM